MKTEGPRGFLVDALVYTAVNLNGRALQCLQQGVDAVAVKKTADKYEV